jgi:hypothetical protein
MDSENSIILFGAGIIGIEAIRFFGERNVYCFADNNKAGSFCSGKYIISVERLAEIQKNHRIVLSVGAYKLDEVAKQLTGLGIAFESYFEIYGSSGESAMGNPRIAALKDTCLGKRICLVGNGASLRAKDLERIQANGITTMACNFITKLFDSTEWRPDYYCCVESSAVILNKDFILNHPTKGKFIKYMHQKEMECVFDNPPDDLLLFHYYVNVDTEEYNDLGEDISKQFGNRYTVMYTMLKIAMYMGFAEILLIGVDNTMPPTVSTENFAALHTHFYDENAGELEERRRIMSKEPVDNDFALYRSLLNKDYKRIRAYAESIGVRVINATRGGILEVFERVDIESLF